MLLIVDRRSVLRSATAATGVASEGGDGGDLLALDHAVDHDRDGQVRRPSRPGWTAPRRSFHMPVTIESGDRSSTASADRDREKPNGSGPASSLARPHP